MTLPGALGGPVSASRPAEAVPATCVVDGLQRRFGHTTAVDGISFSVSPGEVFALLGRNGAGKSTTVRCLAGLDRRWTGSIMIDGLPPAQAATVGKIGYCGQEIALYPRLVAQANIAHFAVLAGRGRREAAEIAVDLAHRLGLDELAKTPAGALSGGFRRRLHVACAIAGAASLVIFDEPTAGVDVDSKECVLDVVRQMGDRVATIFTTHELGDVSRIADRFAIIDRGTLVAEGDRETVAATAPTIIRVEASDPAARDRMAADCAEGVPHPRGATGLDIELHSLELADQMLRRLQGAGGITGWRLVPPGIESMFLATTRAGTPDA